MDTKHGWHVSSAEGLGATPRERPLIIPQGLGEGTTERMEDIDVDAADWMEAVHALSEADPEFAMPN